MTTCLFSVRPRRTHTAAPTPEKRHMRASGLSLIEVVIALFLLSIMSVIILGSYTTGLRIWNNQRTQGITQDTVRAVIKKIRSQVKSAYPWFTKEENTSRLFFKGTPDSLQFASLVGFSSKRDNGLVRIVSYAFERESEDAGLLRIEEYSWPRKGFPENEDPVISEIIDGIVKFSCKYLIRETPLLQEPSENTAPSTGREGEEWVKTWPPTKSGFGKKRYLAAVSIDITARTNQDSREKYSLVIPVHITMEEPSSP